MYVLDTDHLSLLEHRGAFDRQRLLRKLKLVEAEGVSTTIVSFEEQMRGRLAYLSRARTLTQQIDAYRRLREQLDGYRSIPVLDFDESAAREYQRLKGVRTRVGTMDLRLLQSYWPMTRPSSQGILWISDESPTSELKTGFPKLDRLNRTKKTSDRP